MRREDKKEQLITIAVITAIVLTVIGYFLFPPSEKYMRESFYKTFRNNTHVNKPGKLMVILDSGYVKDGSGEIKLEEFGGRIIYDVSVSRTFWGWRFVEGFETEKKTGIRKRLKESPFDDF